MNNQAPRTYNKHHADAPADAIYIGRGGPWGNPFAIGPGETRESVIAKHRAWLLDRPDEVRRVRNALAGRSLVCFCYPKACHGDTLIEIANS